VSVRLRPLGEADEDLYVAIYTDPALLAEVGPPLAPDAARRSFAAALREARKPAPRRRLWVIVEDATATAVGLIGLVIAARDGEMGAVVRREHQGRGLCRAACIECARIGYAGLGLARVHARCTRDNAAAIAVLARAGFVRQPDTGGEVRWEWPPPREPSA
jgi:RimJ/RimL family protein N-acetyltransferase